MLILEKITIFILMFCMLKVVKEALSVYIHYKNLTKIEYTFWDKVSVGAAISYILTIIFTGLSWL